MILTILGFWYCLDNKSKLITEQCYEDVFEINGVQYQPLNDFKDPDTVFILQEPNLPSVNTSLSTPKGIVEKPIKKKKPEMLCKVPIEVCEKYVKRFEQVAIMEKRKYGIPIAIKLAQGILESRAGESTLSTKSNNHFGIKCFKKKCKKGHCTNFCDDHCKDFFRNYKTAWESWRGHSEFLSSSKRYAHLFKIPSTDYKSWAKGLKKAGYATAPTYAETLVHVIETLELYKLDVKH